MPFLTAAIAATAAAAAAVPAGTATALSVAGTVASVAGAGVSYIGQTQQLKEQQKQEEVRNDAMKLDADRKRREIMRASARARAEALTVGTAQGAAAPGGSAIPGAYGQIAGGVNNNLSNVNVAEEQGQAMFESNSRITSASRIAAAGGAASSIGAGLFSLGGALGKSASTLSAVGGNATTQRPINLTAFGGPASW